MNFYFVYVTPSSIQSWGMRCSQKFNVKTHFFLPVEDPVLPYLLHTPPIREPKSVRPAKFTLLSQIKSRRREQPKVDRKCDHGREASELCIISLTLSASYEHHF
jgi:hypothetical protein